MLSQEHRHEIGYGHLYQGRYKCFPVETEDYFYQVVRYVERNALRANLAVRARGGPGRAFGAGNARIRRFQFSPHGRCLAPWIGWKS